MANSPDRTAPVDLFIIGGGVNGCGIARDAAGRGLTVALAEQGDLAQGTSSRSTKLFHGGLRYLEHFEFSLVREALIEREVLLCAMPHISWPLRFVLPHHSGLRPSWLLRLGLFIYDNLGGRKILPATKTLALTEDAAGKPLKSMFRKGFEYSDCWVDDARLVALNAVDAAQRGADIAVRTRCVGAEREDGLWSVRLEDAQTGETREVRARTLINAAGPWVEDVIQNRLHVKTNDRIRLVAGSHVVVPKIFDHDRAYIFQQSDGRIIFAIPYQDDFTLIGTTDHDHDGAPDDVTCTETEMEYLCEAASEYFERPVRLEDVVWTYSGVRSLYDDGMHSATAATRDYVLKVEGGESGAPLLNIFGGKITTYRRLSESALAKLAPHLPEMGEPWTARGNLPGGNFHPSEVGAMVRKLQSSFPFLDEAWASRLIRAYGGRAERLLAHAKSVEDLGQHFGWNLTEREVRYLMEEEWARTAEDVLWRRSKLGLRLSEGEAMRLDAWMNEHRTGDDA